MPFSGGEIHEPPLGKKIYPFASYRVFINEIAYILANALCRRFQLLDIDLDVEMPRVANYSAILHCEEMLFAYDIDIAGHCAE